MGYYTRFNLETVPPVDAEFIDKLNLNEGYNPFEDCTKWYDHEKEMLEVSKKHPQILFILDGNGEEGGDIWCKFFKEGKTYTWRPDITRPKFDPKLLK